MRGTSPSGRSYGPPRWRDRLPIGRFARLSGLTVKALRHYDALGLLPPAPWTRSPGTAGTPRTSWTGPAGSAGCARWTCRWPRSAPCWRRRTAGGPG